MMRVIGVLFIVIGILGLLGGINTPLDFITKPLFNFISKLIDDFSSGITWASLILIGLSLAGPEGGYLRALANKIRK